MPNAPSIKPVAWVGSAKDDLSALHADVKDAIGQALFEAQKGSRHASTKPLSGYGDASVLEIVVDHAGDTYRAVYTVRWPDRLYVLHVFKKKSKSGRKTPKGDLNVIDTRLKRVREHYEATQRWKG
ncbi:MAG TPA: type II toxin-antitoxin system RelE/ParE family toxin [Acetobacteraceae bacterium]|nr:type II toxin-antitoxin system RelE/ParE family toxin [Acetobacteraceae bacterium]